MDGEETSGRMSDIVVVPRHWPPRYNVCTDPCDMLQGPCACGAFHFLDEKWVLNGLKAYGIKPDSVTRNR